MNMNATENNVYAMQKDYGGEMRKIFYKIKRKERLSQRIKK